MKVFLHAGLPRTATTSLQAEVFPKLKTIHYVGKNADNSGVRGAFRAVDLVRECCRRYLAGDQDAMGLLRKVLASLLLTLKFDNAERRPGAETVARVWADCMLCAAETLADKPMLYSDESLSESISGLAGHLDKGDAVPLEQMHAVGLLEHVTLSVVLREPAAFLKASYYKAMEFEHKFARAPYSFDEYIARQLKLRDRSPSASRIFLCMHRTASRHFRQLCPDTHIVSYQELVDSKNVVDTLLGTKTGEEPVALGTLPRENTSWRQPETNAFILSAPGVPAGLSIEAYAQSFPETLRRHGLDELFAEEALP